jgi:hypothetical protein
MELQGPKASPRSETAQGTAVESTPPSQTASPEQLSSLIAPGLDEALGSLSIPRHTSGTVQLRHGHETSWPSGATMTVGVLAV